MSIRLGIGIITCNRKDVLSETVARVRAHTNPPFALVVADDGSEDGTADLMRSQNVTLVTGPNMGIAWNKNRALFLLGASAQCDVMILLEDDSFPTRNGWTDEWVLATEHGGTPTSPANGFGAAF
jgi:GT2 family glycosyltransferase